METLKDKQGMPTQQERPDLYDDYDYVERPEGYQAGIKTPDRIQKLIDARNTARDSKLKPNVG